MYGIQGLTLDSFAKIDGGCPVKCEIDGSEAQFVIGTWDACLNLVFTEEGLEETAQRLATALEQLREHNHEDNAAGAQAG